MVCDTCNGTKLIMTEGILMSRPYYDKEVKQLMVLCQGKGDWENTLCPDCCDDGD